MFLQVTMNKMYFFTNHNLEIKNFTCQHAQFRDEINIFGLGAPFIFWFCLRHEQRLLSILDSNAILHLVVFNVSYLSVFFFEKEFRTRVGIEIDVIYSISGVCVRGHDDHVQKSLLYVFLKRRIKKM